MTTQQLEAGKKYRAYWHEERGYALVVSWGALPPERKEFWANEAVNHDHQNAEMCLEGIQ